MSTTLKIEVTHEHRPVRVEVHSWDHTPERGWCKSQTHLLADREEFVEVTVYEGQRVVITEVQPDTDAEDDPKAQPDLAEPAATE